MKPDPYRSVLALALIAGALVACTHAPPGPVGKSLNEEVYIVGRVELVPPLSADEQELKTIGSGRLRQRGYLFLSDRLIDLTALGMGAGRHAVLVDMNKDFVVKRRAFDEMYYSGVQIWMQSTGASGIEHLNLPGGAVYNLKPGDKAVYIGTLRYHRDVYNGITKIEYIDDYQRALTHFRKETGQAGMMLRKVTPAKMRKE